MSYEQEQRDLRELEMAAIENSRVYDAIAYTARENGNCMKSNARLVNALETTKVMLEQAQFNMVLPLHGMCEMADILEVINKAIGDAK